MGIPHPVNLSTQFRPPAPPPVAPCQTNPDDAETMTDEEAAPAAAADAGADAAATGADGSNEGDGFASGSAGGGVAGAGGVSPVCAAASM